MLKITLPFILLLCCIGNLLASDSLFIEEPALLKTTVGDIHGTLSVPIGTKSKIPVALIISGSGPTDRNGNSPGLTSNCLQVLAHQIARHQIASLRFDKRGVAQSAMAAPAESKLDFDMYVTDVMNWINLLEKDDRFSDVFIIGHSEGSLIGMLAAPFLGLGYISIAGAAEPANKIIRQQLLLQPSSNTDKALKILDTLDAGKFVSDVTSDLSPLFRRSVQPYLLSWFRYNPCEDIKNINNPVMVIQGDNDLQVSVQQAKSLKKCNPKVKLVIIENMNHVMKIAGRTRDENLREYNNPSSPISEKLVTEIAAFIHRHKFSYPTGG